MAFVTGAIVLTAYEFKRWMDFGDVLCRVAGPVEHRSNKMAETRETPNEITFQSSLLALNAALETAAKSEDAAASTVAVEKLQVLSSETRASETH